MKRIIHLGKYYPPEFGGIEKVTSLIVDNDNQNNHVVICFSNSKQIENDNNIFRIPVKLNLFSQPISFQYIVKSLREIKNNDIVHIHLPNIFALIVALFINDKPIILHWHSDIINNKFLYTFIKPLEKMILKKASSIIISSYNYLNNSNSLSLFKSKTKVVPYGIEEPDKDVDNNLLIEDCYPIFENQYILSVGRLVKYKGYENLIMAMINVDAKLIIIGNGPEYKRLQDVILKYNLGNKIFILTDINNTKKKIFYKNASIFCLPSINKSESYGMSIVEAMSYGLPLVTTNLIDSGISWLNKHDATGICVNPNNTNELSNAIKKILQSPDLCKKFSNNSRKRYEDKLTLKIFINKISKIYDEL